MRTITHPPVNSDRCVVGRPCTHLLLQFSEPRAGWQPQLLQAVLPHVDVHALLESKRQRDDVVMLERYGAHPEQRIFEQYPLTSQGAWQRLALEPTSAAKPSTLHSPLGIYLVRDDDEVSLIVIDEIPGVRGELVFELRDESRRTVQAH